MRFQLFSCLLSLSLLHLQLEGKLEPASRRATSHAGLAVSLQVRSRPEDHRASRQMSRRVRLTPPIEPHLPDLSYVLSDSLARSDRVTGDNKRAAVASRSLRSPFISVTKSASGTAGRATTANRL